MAELWLFCAFVLLILVVSFITPNVVFIALLLAVITAYAIWRRDRRR